MSEVLPYQTYRSKRHSTGNSHLIPNMSPPRPSSMVLSMSPLPSSSCIERAQEKYSTPNGKALSPAPPPELTRASSPLLNPEYELADFVPAPSSPAPSTCSNTTRTAVKKVSTFRHVPLRGARSHAPSSPSSGSSTPPPPRNGPSATIKAPQSPISTQNGLINGKQSPSEAQASVFASTALEPNSKSSERDAAKLPSERHAPGVMMSLSAPSSGSVRTDRASNVEPSAFRTRAPIRPGFQPKGLYRSLTDEFLAVRHRKREGGERHGRNSVMNRVEKEKLTRRLEKLIDIHFSAGDSTIAGHNTGASRIRAPALHNRRASSIFDFDIRDIKKLSVSDTRMLWRGVVGGNKAHEMRVAEQRVTPWQDDREVSKCPLCNASFHPLTTRKHHCRLCGQIICALPIKHPQRPTPCSLLFVVDLETRMIEEVSEGVDYGVMNKSFGQSAEDHKFLKGVRICRLCRPILLRRQYQQEVLHVPLLVKLYDAFIAIEREIEEALPRFHEVVLSLSENNQLTKDAFATRKHLLEAFSQYDSLAKRIHSLPCPNGAGSSQERVQIAIMNRANVFLQKNMLSLQALPTPLRTKAQPKLSENEDTVPDPDSKITLILQPLLEQEALLEAFVEEAQARRKFEDVQTLKANLHEIRTEIDKITIDIQAEDNT